MKKIDVKEDTKRSKFLIKSMVIQIIVVWICGAGFLIYYNS